MRLILLLEYKRVSFSPRACAVFTSRPFDFNTKIPKIMEIYFEQFHTDDIRADFVFAWMSIFYNTPLPPTFAGICVAQLRM